jgi:bifunctional ADP-heptose synthase (sugar kinase/adenylyltransferase)
VPQDLRAENLAALEIVDAVTVAPAETAIEVIEQARPDIYVKGKEYAESTDPRFLKEKNLAEKYNGKVVYSSGDIVFSSSVFIRNQQMETANDIKLSYISNRYNISRKVMNGIIENASRKKFLIFGETMLDEYKYCDGLGIAQETPVLSISLKHKNRYIGGSGNLALNLAALGADVSFISSVDMKHQDFAFFYESLNDFNVSCSIIEDKSRPLVVKSHYFVNDNQVLELEDGPYRPIDSTVRARIIRQFKKEIKNAPDCIILSDFGYGLLSGDLVREMIGIAMKKGILLISDIAMTLRTQLDKFYDSDIFCATEMELRSCMHDYENGLSVLVDRFYSVSGVAELYLALADGSSIFFRKPSRKGVHNMENAHIPSLLQRKEDKMGSCEAFTAGVALARANKANQVQSIYLGAVFSALQAMRIGNEPVNQEAIFQLLGERKELLD